MKILFVAHAGYWNEFSGTPLIAKQYMELARERNWEVALLKPAIPIYKNPGAEPVQLPTDTKVLNWKNLANWNLDAFQLPPESFCPEYEIGQLFQPDIVHIIDWVGMDSSILPALKKLGVPIIRHICNFEDLCAFIEPTRFLSDGAACEPPLSEKQCAECLFNRELIEISSYSGTVANLRTQLNNLETEYLNSASNKVKTKWRIFEKHLEYYDHIVFPSTDFCNYFFSQVKTKIPHSILAHGLSKIGAKLDRRSTGVLNCIFLNGASERKGWPSVEGAFDDLLKEMGSNIRLRVYGDAGLAQRSRLSKYAEVEFLNPYDPANIAEVLNWADVGIIPSNFETFCRAVREFILYGVVPIGSSAFGIPDVVKNRKNGIILDRPYEVSLVKVLRELKSNSHLLSELRAGVNETKIISPQEEFGEIEELYVRLVASNTCNVSSRQV